MTLKELLVGFGTQVRSIWMIGLHAFAKRETRMYRKSRSIYRPVTVVVSCSRATRTVKSAALPVTCVR